MRKTTLSGALALLMTSMSAGAQQWQSIPLVTPGSRAAGNVGGEGCQWPQALAVDATGQFLLFGTDVGGLFRSRDGGAHWEPCNVGFSPRGTCGLAIDPHNPRRCLAVGANSLAAKRHGLYLSTDGAASWRAVLPAEICGHGDKREQIAYDPNTYDKKSGCTRVAFWSRIAEDKADYGSVTPHPALYKTTDGGATWAELPGTRNQGGCVIRVHPGKAGTVYAGGDTGFWRSADGGHKWVKTLDGPVTGVDVSPKVSDSVWVSRANGVWRSPNAGRTWTQLNTGGLTHGADALRNVHVSPADPRRLLVWRRQMPDGWSWPRFFSDDGGKTWHESKKDDTGAFMPDNAREGLFVWHPRDARTAWSVGGDWPTKSTDGGQTWRWSGNGDNGILVGGGFNFNSRNPDVLFVASQDYNGGVTRDGGRTWAYTNVSGNGWGGFTYGGYALSPGVLTAGDAPGWGGPRAQKVSRDGGRTWTPTGQTYTGPDIACGDPSDPSVAFASNLRTADGGQTWAAMPGCDAVFTASAGPGHTLYGIKSRTGAKATDIVRSTDHGVTWRTIATFPDVVRDLAFDHVHDRLYAVGPSELSVWENNAWRTVETPPDQTGGRSVSSVAVDPADPSVVYAASHRDWISTSVAVARSTDAGATWRNLTATQPLRPGVTDGGREATWVRVHPKTRYLWVATSCYGLWKIGPPRAR